MGTQTAQSLLLADFDARMRPLVARLRAGLADELGYSLGDPAFQYLTPPDPLGPDEVDKGDDIFSNGGRYIFGIKVTDRTPPLKIQVELRLTQRANPVIWEAVYNNLGRGSMKGDAPSDDSVATACKAIASAARERWEQDRSRYPRQ